MGDTASAPWSWCQPRSRTDRLGTADWCRLSGLGTIQIEPGSPWENPWIQSLNGRARDELLNITEFGSLAEAGVVIED